MPESLWELCQVCWQALSECQFWEIEAFLSELCSKPPCNGGTRGEFVFHHLDLESSSYLGVPAFAAFRVPKGNLSAQLDDPHSATRKSLEARYFQESETSEHKADHGSSVICQSRTSVIQKENLPPTSSGVEVAVSSAAENLGLLRRAYNNETLSLAVLVQMEEANRLISQMLQSAKAWKAKRSAGISLVRHSHRTLCPDENTTYLLVGGTRGHGSDRCRTSCDCAGRRS